MSGLVTRVGYRLNGVFARVGLHLGRLPSPTPQERERYERALAAIRTEASDVLVFREPRWGDGGNHPETYRDFECAFAATHVRRANPSRILDIGSYRQFILGLLAHYPVTTVDVRDRPAACPNETVVTCDAKELPLPDGSFDVVVSLCALEHFGLGRYGDPLDLDADRKALAEMKRVLRPGGHLVFTTTITAAPPAICFNAHRLYDHPAIRHLCGGFVPIAEQFFSSRLQRLCARDELTREPGRMDVYHGCYRKP